MYARSTSILRFFSSYEHSCSCLQDSVYTCAYTSYTKHTYAYIHCEQYSVDTYEDILRDILGDRRMIDIGTLYILYILYTYDIHIHIL
jgi:hypothetical protein